MRQTLLTLTLLCCLPAAVFSKGSASLSGKITSASGEALRNVSLTLKKEMGSSAAQILRTGANGKFSFAGLDSGIYSTLITSAGFESQRIIAIDINKEALLLNASLSKAGIWGNSIASRRYVTEQRPSDDSRKAYRYRRDMTSAGKGKGSHTVLSYSAPLIEAESAGGRAVKSAEMIERAPTRSTSDKAASRTETYSGSSSSISIGGGRASGTKYVVDGVALSSGSATTISAAPESHAGMLTSGEINDFAKWTLWEDMSMDALKGYRTTWPFRPEARYTVLVKSKTGMPLCNARVKMSNGSGEVWEAITDNTGKAELWYGIWDAAAPGAGRLSANVEYGPERFSIPALKPFAEGVNILATKLSCLNPAKLDIAFVVDATGSMGDEINYLKAELRDILRKVHDSMPAAQVQTGALFYRDLDDVYLTRISDFTPDFSKTEAFIADNSADGGGDTPEAVDAALEEALNAFHWRADATARLAFLVLDAPPHSDAATVKRMQMLTAQYAAKGIRLIPVVCSGSDKPTEYLMRSLALATNGTYLFLTDHSGIGSSHTAPTTDKYDVEYLNGLIYRVIYQCAYMPSCNEAALQPGDTASVQQRTDSVTISWRYYPNPTTGILHIEHTHTAGYLFITDVTGKAILRVPADASGITTIDLRQYPAGIYAVRYNWADDKWVSGKFVLLH